MRARRLLDFLCIAVLFVIGSCTPEAGKQESESAVPPAVPAEESASATEAVTPVPETETPESEPAAIDMAAAEAVFKASCFTCHKVDKVEHHAKEGLAEEPWNMVVKAMVEEKGAAISAEDQKTVLAYLEAKYGK